jgi:hypothetical protein
MRFMRDTCIMITSTHILDTRTLPFLFVADADENKETDLDSETEEGDEEETDSKFIKDEEKFIDDGLAEEEAVPEEDDDNPLGGAEEYGDGRDM